MKKSKHKKVYHNYLLALAVVIIVVSLSVIFYHGLEIERKSLQVRYEIGSMAGFNIESDTLNFGRILPSGKSTRTIMMENTHDFDVRVRVKSSDNLENLLYFNKSFHTLGMNNNLSLPITLVAPQDAMIGNYTGFIVVQIYK